MSKTTPTLLLLAMLVVGCKGKSATKSKSNSDDDDARPRNGSSAPRGSASAALEKKAESEGAYRLGMAYASALFYFVYEQPDKSRQQMEIAETGGRLLGIAPPPPPSDSYRKTVEAMSREIEKKHGSNVAHLFLLGGRLEGAATQAASMKDEKPADIASGLKNFFADLDVYFPKSGLPESLWKASYEEIKANPSSRKLFGLQKIILDHLKK